MVQADGQRVFHGGDTMFHGYWWLIARRFSPFDAVFLPANGAVVDAPHLQPPSPLPAAMDPRQAAAAAEILDARYAVPMHYEAEQPDKIAGYVEVSDPENEFRTHAGHRAHVLPIEEWLDLATPPRQRAQVATEHRSDGWSGIAWESVAPRHTPVVAASITRFSIHYCGKPRSNATLRAEPNPRVQSWSWAGRTFGFTPNPHLR
ncbi:MBL fold metallo-hydrolase [Saccharopolyspora sp. NPDC000995]